MASHTAPQQDDLQDRARDHEHAARPPRSSTWRVELVVAVLGLVIGLTAALAFLG